jgi:hypothetical protein
VLTESLHSNDCFSASTVLALRKYVTVGFYVLTAFWLLGKALELFEPSLHTGNAYFSVSLIIPSVLFFEFTCPTQSTLNSLQWDASHLFEKH